MGLFIMKDKDNVHNGCPNKGHCSKDESKCCYLLSTQQCYIELEHSEDFI